MSFNPDSKCLYCHVDIVATDGDKGIDSSGVLKCYPSAGTMSTLHKPRLNPKANNSRRQEIEEEYYVVRQTHIDAQARVKETHYLELEAHKLYLKKLHEEGL